MGIGWEKLLQSKDARLLKSVDQTAQVMILKYWSLAHRGGGMTVIRVMTKAILVRILGGTLSVNLLLGG